MLPNSPKVLPIPTRRVVPRSEEELEEVFLRKKTRPQLPPAPVSLNRDSHKAKIPPAPVCHKTRCLDSAQLAHLRAIVDRISLTSSSRPPSHKQTILLLRPADLPVSGTKRPSPQTPRNKPQPPPAPFSIPPTLPRVPPQKRKLDLTPADELEELFIRKKPRPLNPSLTCKASPTPPTLPRVPPQKRKLPLTPRDEFEEMFIRKKSRPLNPSLPPSQS